MKAMILAAGHGTRMRPLTDHTPKPLLKVGNKPLIVWHVEKLKRAGIEDIIINIAWLGEQIPAALGDGSAYGVHIQYSDEQQQGALETAGGIVNALDLIGDAPFLVINGDVWCDYTLLAESPLQHDDLAHLILVNNPEHNPKGDFALAAGRVQQQGQQKFTFSGIAYYQPELFMPLRANIVNGTLPKQQPLAPLLREAMDSKRVSGEYFAGDWRDIGTPERLQVLDAFLSG